MSDEQTAGEPVACGCNGTDTVCVAHSGTVASAPHPRPRVGVTAEDVKLLRSVCEYVAEERLVLLYESGFLRDMSLEGEFRASVAGLPDRVLALADSPAPLANGGGEVGP